MKKIVTAIAVATLTLSLAGCVSAQYAAEHSTEEVTVTLKDGRVMECLHYGAGRGSIDCNWAGAK